MARATARRLTAPTVQRGITNLVRIGPPCVEKDWIESKAEGTDAGAIRKTLQLHSGQCGVACTPFKSCCFGGRPIFLERVHLADQCSVRSIDLGAPRLQSPSIRVRGRQAPFGVGVGGWLAAAGMKNGRCLRGLRHFLRGPDRRGLAAAVKGAARTSLVWATAWILFGLRIF